MTEGFRTGRGLLATMALVVVCGGVVQGYLTPLLPGIGRHIGTGGVGQNNLYLLSQLAFAVMTPLLSRLGDLHGHRRLLRLAVSLVAAGSLLMAVRPTTATLAAGMLLQGAVVGFFPLLAGILRTRAPERARTGISVLVGVLLVSIGTGGLVAGTFSEAHAVAGLWTAVPVSVLALAAALLLPDSGAARGGRLDIVAATLLTLGLVALVLVLAQGGAWGWTSPATLGASLLALLLLAAWARAEHRSPHPLVDLRLLRGSRLALVNAHTFCLAFGTIGFLGANSVFLGTGPDTAGHGMGLGSRDIATVSLGMVLAGFLGSTATPRVARRTGDGAVVAAGGALGAAGFLGMALGHDTLPRYLVGALLVGLATGVFEAITRTLAAESVAEDETAVSVGLNELALSLGAAIGAAVTGALLAAHRTAGAGGGVSLDGFRWSWGVCAAVALLGALPALGLRERTTGPPSDHAAGPAPAADTAS